MKKLLIILLSVGGVLIAGAGGYAYYLYDSAKQAANNMYEPVHENPKSPEAKKEREKTKEKTENLEPISILLLGVDKRPGDVGRSDSMVVMTLNPNKKSMYMFNIPRDTRTLIVGKGYVDKINHAYAFGGVSMSMKTVENFLNIPIDYYIKVNMESFQDVVNAVGGVNVSNDNAFRQGGHYFSTGQLHLNGDEALAYARMRKKDPRGDFGRTSRQREILKAVIEKGTQYTSVTKLDNVLQVLGNNVQTNMTFEDMKTIFKDYRAAASNIKQFEIDGHGEMISDIWYYIVPDAEQQRITARLKEHLGRS